MMTYENILYAIALTLAGFVLHVVWWRVRRPKDDVRALFLCLVVVPVVLVLVRAVGALDSEPPGPVSMDSLVVALLSTVLGCSYIISYPGAQAASPSMLFLLKIAEQGENGIRREDLIAYFGERTLGDETFASLVHERFAHAVNGRLVPAPRGVWMVWVCRAWRALLGLKDGEG